MTVDGCFPHQPVMVREVLNLLVLDPDGIYVDATSGSGGHSVAILRQLSEKGRLISIDRDPVAVGLTAERIARSGKSRTITVKENYVNLDRLLIDLNISKVNGILLDLGMSSYQIDLSQRGFSFLREEPLDMRMDPSDPVTADEIVNESTVEELTFILRTYGEEKRAKAIAKAIVRERRKNRIESSSHLAAIVSSVFPPSQRAKGRHPATRTFQAIRIAVNQEIQNIDLFLKKVPGMLHAGGRLVVLSYHSLEDRLVKRAMVDWERVCTCPPDFPVCVCGKTSIMKRVTKKGIRPGKEEISVNPRARSAILRAAERRGA